MKEVVHSLTLWVILASLVVFVSRTEAQETYRQQASVCSEGRDFADVSNYICR